jgi:hypothetical protein
MIAIVIIIIIVVVVVVVIVVIMLIITIIIVINNIIIMIIVIIIVNIGMIIIISSSTEHCYIIKAANACIRTSLTIHLCTQQTRWRLCAMHDTQRFFYLKALSAQHYAASHCILVHQHCEYLANAVKSRFWGPKFVTVWDVIHNGVTQQKLALQRQPS